VAEGPEQQDPGRVSGSGHRTLRLGGRDLLVDSEGFLVHFEDWSEEAARELAQREGLEEPGDRHWRVLCFLRGYYRDRGKAPLGREIREGLGMSLLEIETLFPGGLKGGARRLAGLPNPRGCL
jgi:dissimilatory sulfite reductase related protein